MVYLSSYRGILQNLYCVAVELIVELEKYKLIRKVLNEELKCSSNITLKCKIHSHNSRSKENIDNARTNIGSTIHYQEQNVFNAFPLNVRN